MAHNLFFIAPIFLAIAILASAALYFQRPNPRYLRLLAAFLMVNLIGESIEDYMAMRAMNTLVLGNITTAFSFACYMFILREIVFRPKAKKVFLYFLIIYPIIFLLNIFLVQKIDNFNTMTFSLGCLVIVSMCVYYFLELFQTSHSVNLMRQPAFWICSGLAFHYACSFPLLGLVNFIKNVPDVVLQNLLIIWVFLNIFLYLSFTIAFLCRLKTRKSL